MEEAGRKDKLKDLDDDKQKNIATNTSKVIDDYFLVPEHYPEPVVLKRKYKFSSKKYSLAHLSSDKAAMRVLAPYFKTIRREQKKLLKLKQEKKEKEKKFMSVMLEKKLSELSKTVSEYALDEDELIQVLHGTADVLKSITNSEDACVYLVNNARQEIYLSPKYTKSPRHQVTWKIETAETIAAYAAKTKKHVITHNMYTDTRFRKGVGWSDSYIKYAMCIPVTSPLGIIIAVLQMGRDITSEPYEMKDMEILIAVASWMSTAIYQNQLRIMLGKQLEISEYLLKLVKGYFAEDVALEDILSEIMVYAREMIGAERCAYYIIDKDYKNEIIADFYDESIENRNVLLKRRNRIRITKEASIPTTVITTKECVNKKLGPHPQVDQHTGIVIHTVLAMPIICNNTVLGVVMLMNKKMGEEFDKDDEKLFEIFTLNCTLALNYVEVKGKEKKSEHNTKICEELLAYHMRPCGCEEKFYKNVDIEKINLPNNFYSYAWYPQLTDTSIRLMELLMHMFHTTLGPAFMSMNDFGTFVVIVKNSYRENPYHNFEHGFLVAHTMANMVYQNNSYFTGLEAKSMMIAALCHDVDHRGYTNNFVQLSEHALGKLYNSSQLENHHFFVTQMIIKAQYGMLSKDQDRAYPVLCLSKQCNMFSYMKRHIYNQMMDEILNCIIATDLVVYFHRRMQLVSAIEQYLFSWKNEIHRTWVKGLMMTACDLSAQTKAFPYSERLTVCLYDEFYLQGDIEKKMGLTPLATMDRHKADSIPTNQVQFLSVVVMPCVNILSRILVSVKPMYYGCRLLQKQWQEIVDHQDQETWKPLKSLVDTEK